MRQPTNQYGYTGYEIQNRGLGSPEGASGTRYDPSTGSGTQNGIWGLGTGWGGNLPGALGPASLGIGSVSGLNGQGQPQTPGAGAAGGNNSWLDMLKAYFEEMNKPLDLNDPYTRNILQGAQSAASGAASDRGIQGGMNVQAGQQAYINSAAQLQQQRQQMALQALQSGMQGANEADRTNLQRWLLDYQSRAAGGGGVGSILGGLVGGAAGVGLAGLTGGATTGMIPGFIQGGAQVGGSIGGMGGGGGAGPVPGPIYGKMQPAPSFNAKPMFAGVNPMAGTDAGNDRSMMPGPLQGRVFGPAPRMGGV